jgi:hypothetical protein
MNKAQALTWLGQQTWCKAVDTPKLIETKFDGGKRYRVDVCEVAGNVCNYKSIEMLVRDEGGAGETAYYHQYQKTPGADGTLDYACLVCLGPPWLG